MIAERDFDGADQERFAVVSGDRNPMHMDAVAARRTPAGFPVVHGAHALLWALDSVFRHLPDLAPVASIKVRFEKMIHVGDHVQALLASRTEKRLRVELAVEGSKTVHIDIALGDPPPAQDAPPTGPILRPAVPLVPTFEEMADCHGRVPFLSPADEAARMFPMAAAALGAQRVAGLACSSFVVGMVCPGLHSIYRSLNLHAAPAGRGDPDALNFRVVHCDSRFQLIRMAITGGGWTGTIEAHVRPEPVAQPDLASVASRIVAGEFRGASALVVGGSRGLGELIGKIAAAGGAHVTLTYAVGEFDARRVQAEIVAFGGSCDILHYDVRASAGEQLSALPRPPNQVYYLPTPAIFQRKDGIFSRQRFEAFSVFYLSGFHDLCTALQARYGSDIGFFYPSSVAVETRPADMTEYAMAKAAGEVLCADMQSFDRTCHILVRRLPRLATDQTSSLMKVAVPNAIDVMLPIVRELHASQSAAFAAGQQARPPAST